MTYMVLLSRDHVMITLPLGRLFCFVVMYFRDVSRRRGEVCKRYFLARIVVGERLDSGSCSIVIRFAIRVYNDIV